ncbi:hypothetical protein S40288_07766 [Stachybotrys chartarum IBT 40288]|nr:hypothetical protein S40288_07766 [Stachybotrys chartarum IBT 40288]
MRAIWAGAFLPWPALVAAATRRDDDGGAVWVTPHDSYSSSVGVLGCKINTNRVAYWPGSVDCTNICVRLSHQGRRVNLLRIDQSGGAYDVSYDAWNYLYTGHSATDQPAAGGAVEMQFENLDASGCADLIHTRGHRLPLSAANSMNFLASCLDQEDSWVARHYVLYNVLDAVCSLGRDERCELDWPNANQPSCPSTLGEQVVLDDAPVYNIRYPTGETVVAGSGEVVESGSGFAVLAPGSVAKALRRSAWLAAWAMLASGAW